MNPEVDLLDMQEQFAAWVASVTGVKAQLVDSGWTPENAELMVLEMMRQAGRAS